MNVENDIFKEISFERIVAKFIHQKIKIKAVLFLGIVFSIQRSKILNIFQIVTPRIVFFLIFIYDKKSVTTQYNLISCVIILVVYILIYIVLFIDTLNLFGLKRTLSYGIDCVINLY